MNDKRKTTSSILDADWARLAKESGMSSPKRPRLAFLSPRFAPVALIRIACGMEQHGWCRLAKVFALLNFMIFGIEFSTRAQIGPGLIIPHTQGIVLGARSIGSNVTIYQQVTLGASDADYGYDPVTRPVIEDDVTLTAGVKVIGSVTVGRGTLVGANGVVVRDLPPNVIAGGVPARILRDNRQNAE